MLAGADLLNQLEQLGQAAADGQHRIGILAGTTQRHSEAYQVIGMAVGYSPGQQDRRGQAEECSRGPKQGRGDVIDRWIRVFDLGIGDLNEDLASAIEQTHLDVKAPGRHQLVEQADQ
ncbi:hypothetical protein DPPLL_07730 [Desulfofustis limnaeus]|uniref:Uncharacterized protein n=1 Tax=Desulfofustis limnaeus TaxID=2740163 RepID=A0ABM7W6D8_9BACT|nr:hypothetical protein DPPLL_07730 [Desulfofustis limnaeus]